MVRNLNFNGVVKGLVAAGCLGLAANVSASSHTFFTFSDFSVNGDDDSNGYDATATAAGAGSHDTLDLVVATDGVGNSEFKADSSGTLGAFDNDQISFQVSVPSNYLITGFSFSETLTTDTSAGDSIAAATLNIDVNGQTFDMGSRLFTGGSSGDMFTIGKSDVDIMDAQILNISVDNNLFAANGGIIEKGISTLEFETKVVPLPPAVWLLGSAVLGLVSIGRARRRG